METHQLTENEYIRVIKGHSGYNIYLHSPVFLSGPALLGHTSTKKQCDDLVKDIKSKVNG